MSLPYCVLFSSNCILFKQVEDEDEWEDGAQEIGIVGNEIDELGPTAREIEGRRRGNNLWEYVLI